MAGWAVDAVSEGSLQGDLTLQLGTWDRRQPPRPLPRLGRTKAAVQAALADDSTQRGGGCRSWTSSTWEQAAEVLPRISRLRCHPARWPSFWARAPGSPGAVISRGGTGAPGGDRSPDMPSFRAPRGLSGLTATGQLGWRPRSDPSGPLARPRPGPVLHGGSWTRTPPGATYRYRCAEHTPGLPRGCAPARLAAPRGPHCGSDALPGDCHRVSVVPGAPGPRAGAIVASVEQFFETVGISLAELTGSAWPSLFSPVSTSHASM